MLMAGSVLGAITTLTKAGTVMFSAASLDPLLSLPLPRRTVVLSRVFSLFPRNICHLCREGCNFSLAVLYIIV